jgi:hypothetical protein
MAGRVGDQSQDRRVPAEPEVTGRPPNVAGRIVVPHHVHTNLPSSAIPGGGQGTILPLPCGRALAIDTGGHIRGVGTPPEQSKGMACTRADFDELSSVVGTVSEASRKVGERLQALFARERILVSAVESLVAAVRHASHTSSEHKPIRDASARLCDQVCDEVHHQIRSLRPGDVEPLDKGD